MIKKLFLKYHAKWANEKLNIFFNNVKNLPVNATVLDLGGSDGSYMDRMKKHFPNTYSMVIADIDESSLQIAKEKGYNVILMDASSGGFQFKDKEFDCIFCNSAIEHVTIDKDRIWTTIKSFRKESLEIQKKFADEIRRCARSYYVQTPHRHFPIEAHTWFPLISYMPRFLQIFTIRVLNTFWVKKTKPDWNLLDEKQMLSLFPDAKIFVLKKMGFKKEIIAIKTYT